MSSFDHLIFTRPEAISRRRAEKSNKHRKWTRSTVREEGARSRKIRQMQQWRFYFPAEGGRRLLVRRWLLGSGFSGAQKRRGTPLLCFLFFFCFFILDFRFLFWRLEQSSSGTLPPRYILFSPVLSLLVFGITVETGSKRSVSHLHWEENRFRMQMNRDFGCLYSLQRERIREKREGWPVW